MIHGAHAHAARFPLVQPFIKVFNLGVNTFQRHPFLVKTLTSGVGFAVGDSLTQLATRREGEPYDWPRTVAMGGAGVGIAGPLGFFLIVWMESNIMPTAPTSRLAMTTKLTLDQVLGGILWQAALLTINEPYRAAALDLWRRFNVDVKKRLRKPRATQVIAR